VARQSKGREMDLAARFSDGLIRLQIGEPSSRVLIAVSGGLDSMVLLHLLRFRSGLPPSAMIVAHLDHAMRPESDADRRWLAGVCRAWAVPIVHERLDLPPSGESDARQARYRFLHEVASREGASDILTAHHADDQAETVLFRILRGTGIHGLRGIPERSASGVVRPLLSFWRTELETYARTSGLRWRTDATNRSLHPARNQIRHRLLPEVERGFAPAARRKLVELAAEAAEVESALEEQVRAAEHAVVTRDGEAFVLARPPLLRYDSATVSRLLRTLLRRFGTVLSRAGTRSALQFITDASSGREFSLAEGVVMRVEFDRIRLEKQAGAAVDRPLIIPRLRPGSVWSGNATIGGSDYRIAAEARATIGADEGDGGRDDGAWSATLRVPESGYPLEVRGWLPGDRVRTTGGTKSLKKLFLELRVPRSRRHRLPVVADAGGGIIWVAGIERPLASAPVSGAEALLLKITNA
jgi:tRNA(Ile)-lysidine synthase